MSKNFVGIIIQVILIIVGYVFMALYYVGLIDTSRAQTVLLNEAQLVIDKIADSKEITQADLDDYALAFASTSIPVKFTIIRKVKAVNPDPLSTTIPKRTITTWIPTNNIQNWEQGDIVVIKVEQLGNSFSQDFAQRVLHAQISKVNFQLSKMVR